VEMQDIDNLLMLINKVVRYINQEKVKERLKEINKIMDNTMKTRYQRAD
jgi:hypothetical protein